ncbi:MAG: phosphoserine phosphatase SerB [Dermatophilaceae bacterium]
MPTPTETLHVTLTGPDRPGVTSALFAAVAEVGADVLDLEQIVVRDHLTLSALLQPHGAPDTLAAVATTVGREQGLLTHIRRGVGDSHRRRSGRAQVVVLGRPLTASAMSRVATSIAAQNANIDRIRRLSRYPVTTIELSISGADLTGLRAALAGVASEHRIDIAVAPAGLDRLGTRLVVMDVDSTFIQQEVIDLLAACAGRTEQVSALTARAMRGEIDFAESLRQRVRALAGLDVAALDDVRRSIVLTPGARTLVRTLRRLGHTVALVSGGFIQIVGPVAAELGIALVAANDLEVIDGRLTGRMAGELVDRAAKARALRRFAVQADVPLSRTVAVGDGANDLDMLETAGLGIAFNAKPIVRRQADTSVTVPYLDAVLYLLGISRDDVDEADALDGMPLPDPEVTAPARP